MHEKHPGDAMAVLQPHEITGVTLLQADDSTTESGRRVLDDQIALGGDLRCTRFGAARVRQHITSVSVFAHDEPP